MKYILRIYEKYLATLNRCILRKEIMKKMSFSCCCTQALSSQSSAHLPFAKRAVISCYFPFPCFGEEIFSFSILWINVSLSFGKETFPCHLVNEYVHVFSLSSQSKRKITYIWAWQSTSWIILGKVKWISWEGHTGCFFSSLVPP